MTERAMPEPTPEKKTPLIFDPALGKERPMTAEERGAATDFLSSADFADSMRRAVDDLAAGRGRVLKAGEFPR